MPKSKVRKPKKKTARRANPQSARLPGGLHLLPEGKSDPRPIREIPELLEMIDRNLVLELDLAESLLAGSNARAVADLAFAFLTASLLASEPDQDDEALAAHFADLYKEMSGILVPCAISQEKCGRIKDGLREAHELACRSKPQDVGSAELYAMSLIQHKRPDEVFRERFGAKREAE